MREATQPEHKYSMGKNGYRYHTAFSQRYQSRSDQEKYSFNSNKCDLNHNFLATRLVRLLTRDPLAQHFS